jgi:hypothetical protein
MRIAYHEALEHPEEVSRKIAEFLGVSLNTELMRQQVDASLYRNRTV